MKIIFLILFSLCYTCVYSQLLDKYDTMAANIPDSITHTPESLAQYLINNFKTDQKIIRALFIWEALNIRYDIDKSEKIWISKDSLSNDALVLRTLKIRKGICVDYSGLFNKVLNICGIKNYIIDGYVKTNGNITIDKGHCWNIAKIDNCLYLFDPTWGAGYVRFEHFHKKLDYTYFETNPDTLIKTHMPFDPIWQLKEIPVSHSYFLNNTDSNENKISFNDSISKYDSLDEYQKLISSIIRTEQFGINNTIFNKFYETYKDNLKYDFLKKSDDCFKNVVKKYNNVVNQYNNYISHTYNKTSSKTTPENMTKMLNGCLFDLNNCPNYANLEKEISSLKSEIKILNKKLNSLKVKKSIENKKY